MIQYTTIRHNVVSNTFPYNLFEENRLCMILFVPNFFFLDDLHKPMWINDDFHHFLHMIKSSPKNHVD